MTQHQTTYMSVPQVARALEVDRRTVVRLIDKGQLEAIRFGRAYRIKRASYDQLVEQSTIRRSA